MPAKDKYHDVVLNALRKDGWRIVEENLTMGDEVRHLIVDVLARREEQEAILIEIKVFENLKSPMTYLQHVVGQYMLYKAMVDYSGVRLPLYLALPNAAYQDLFAEAFVAHTIKYLKLKLLVYEPQTEKVVLWTH
jgi:hypothetical protein